MIKPYGTTIFCDDIRTENNGKHLLVGVYDDAMLVQGELPSLIPTFAFLVRLFEPKSYVGKDAALRIFVPNNGDDNPALDVTLPLERWRKLDQLSADPEATYLGSYFQVKISPMQITHEGLMKVRAYYGAEEIKLGTLLIKKNDSLSDLL